MKLFCLFGLHEWYYSNIRKEEIDIGGLALFLPFLFLGTQYQDVCIRKCLKCNKEQKVARTNNGNWNRI